MSLVVPEESTKPEDRSKHFVRHPPLDALRGVAITLVILHHVWWRFPLAHDEPLSQFVAGIGWAGVDLFFGISGYLITTILIKPIERTSIRSFFIKRFFRIVPIYLVAVTVFALTSLLTGNDRDVLERIWINFLLLTAWFIPFTGENGVPYTISWSVSVEEFAYIFFGTMAALGHRVLASSLPWVIVGALSVRVVSVVFFAFEPITLYYFAPGRIDAIAMGGAMAMLSQSMRERIVVSVWLPWGLWLVTVAACSQIKRESVIVATIGYSAVAIASAWLVLCVASIQSKSNWRLTKWFASLGLVSYFVYLFHGFVIGALSRILPAAAVLSVGIWGVSLLTIFLTYSAARASWQLFEYPLILRGRRIAGDSARRGM